MDPVAPPSPATTSAPLALAGPLDAPPVALTRFQRMLLGTDGTVTHILEAYAEEPIDVVKLHQHFDVADGTDAALEVPDGDRVLRRRVLLRGRHSGRNLLYAEAVVAADRADPAFLEGVLATDKPIGLLLAEGRTETFREILAVGAEPAGPSGAHFGLEGDAELIFRIYRIVASGRPVVQITERFPPDSFRDLPA